MTTLTFTEV